MQAAPVSVAPLPENIDIASLKLSDTGSTGNFQALLNINQANSDQPSADNNKDNNNRQNSHDQAPVAAAIDVTVQIVSAPPVQSSQDDVAQSQGNAPVQNTSNDQNPTPASGTNQNTPENSAPASTTASNTDNSSSPTQNNVSPNNVGQNNTGLASTSKKQLRSALQDQLGNIDQILQAITQALSAGAAGQTTSSQAGTTAGTSSSTIPDTTTPAISSSTTNIPVSTLPQQNIAQLGADLDVATLALVQAFPNPQTTTDAANTGTMPTLNTGSPSATSALSILNNLQSILQQMQQDLQGSGNQQPATGTSATPSVTPAGNMDNLDTLAQMMQQDAAQLSQLLSGQANTSNNSQPAITSDVTNIISASTLLPQNSASDTATGNTQAANGTQLPQSFSVQAANNNPQPVTPSNVTPVTPAFIPLPQSFASNATTAPATNTANSPADLTNLLNAGVSEVKTQLQNLKSTNDTQPASDQQSAQAKIDLQSAFTNAQQFFKDAPASTDTTVTASTAATSASTTGATPVITSDQTVVTPTTGNSDQAFIAPASIIDVAQSGSNNSTDTNSGNGDHGQNASQAVFPASVDKATTTPAAGAASFSRVLNGVSSGSVIEQVAFQVKTAQNDGSSKINIQLDPAELGKLEIKLNVGADGKTNVVITADNRNTLNMLQSDSQGLTRALNDAGLSTDSGSLNFNLRGDQQGQGQQNQGGNAQAALTYQQAQPDPEEDIAINNITKSYTVNMSGGLDISI